MTLWTRDLGGPVRAMMRPARVEISSSAARPLRFGEVPSEGPLASPRPACRAGTTRVERGLVPYPAAVTAWLYLVVDEVALRETRAVVRVERPWVMT